MFLEVPNVMIVVLNLTVIPICHVVPSWLLTRKEGKLLEAELAVRFVLVRKLWLARSDY